MNLNIPIAIIGAIILWRLDMGKPMRHFFTRKRLLTACSWVLIGLTAAIFAVLIAAYRRGEFRDIASMQAFVARLGGIGPLFLTGFQAAQVVIPVLPGFLGCATGSALFGPFVGFWCNYIGISLGSIISFYLARKYGMPLIADLFPLEKYSKWSDWIAKSKSYTLFLFLAILLPLFPDDYLCYLTGVSKMDAKKFIWIILLGKPWCILAYSLGFAMI